MPYCPRCMNEYPGGLTHCPDCHERLLAQMPGRASAAAVRPDDSWVGVCRLAGGDNSEIVKDALDSNNIPSIVMSSAYQALTGESAAVLPSACGNIVMVPREFHEEAEIILEAVLGDGFARMEIRQ